MVIEIHGADFRNKGSELMLRTTVNELKKRLPDSQFVVDPLIGSFSDRSGLKLQQYFPPRGWMGSSKFKYLFPFQKTVGSIAGNSSIFKKLCKTYGAVTLDEVDALIDISGFAFTSQWGAQPCVDFASLATHYRKRDKPVIMLPQAFGPFEGAEIKNAITDVINNTDLIYARDKTSYDYLKEIDERSKNNIQMAPDITFFYPSNKSNYRDINFKNECLLIPNTRMLDQGAEEGWDNKYLSTLLKIHQYLNKQGRNPAILIHDSTGKDLKIAERLGDMLNEDIQVYDIADPIEIKKKIATAPFVVTSRYHGAIASFSQGVPSLCMGWSHKYNELYDSFRMSNFIISPDDNFDLIIEQLDKLSDTKENKRMHNKISGFLQAAKQENETMWEKVLDKLI